MTQYLKEQASPIPNNQKPVWNLVIEDMRERNEMGRAKYGTYLQANNGRDALVDAYQEILDLSVYIRQEIEERRDLSFVGLWNRIQFDANQNAHAKGWWDEPREDGTLVALMHSELSELLEFLRHGNPPSDHIPEYSGAEEELADEVIRIMDFAHERKLRVGEAIVAKMEYNRTRPHKHGGKQF